MAVGDDLLGLLRTSNPRRFADWPDPMVPVSGPGAYSIWHRGTGQFLYVGIAGTSGAKPGKAQGLARRLSQHAAGARSGDRFCIYVQDRFILPRLSAAEIAAVAERRLSLDSLVRSFVRGSLGHRFAATATATEARAIEARSNGATGLTGHRC